MEKAMFFSVVMYGCESWTIKKAECRRIDAFELWCWRRLLRGPLDCKEIKPVNPKGNQSWIFIGRTDAEAPVLWPPDGKNWLTGKDPDAGKDWKQEEKGMTEDEMVGWHHWLDGHEFEQAPGVGDGQGSLACCSPWGRKQLDTTEQLNWWRKRASHVAQTRKNLLEMHEIRVQSLGWEDPVEKGMATHSSILAWRIPGTEEPGGLQYRGSQRVGHNWTTNTLTHEDKK